MLIYVKAHFHIASKKLKPRMTSSLEKKSHINGDKRTEARSYVLKLLLIVLCLRSLEATLTLMSHRDNIPSSIISDFSK